MATGTAGDILRAARKRAHLTQTEVGKRLPGNVTATYVSDLERGRRPLTAERIPQFIRVLKLTREEAYAVYQGAGILPDDVLSRFLREPRIWDLDFKAVAAMAPELSRREVKNEL